MNLVLSSRNFFFLVLLFLSSFQSNAQEIRKDSAKPAVIQRKGWFENINLRGYVQVRYNRLLETNPNLGCEQCDASWGDGGGFLIRRTRLIFSGNVHPRIYFYIQPDLASSAGSGRLHFAQLRDAYFDVSLDDDREFRFRIGQSKVPYGFENMQSSQNRLPLDRADPTNSALKNERDLGVFFYWAPKETRELFSYLVREGYKGSGDYGVVGIGAYNGQTANSEEENLNKHVVARVSYPIKLKDQIIEPGIQAYTGKYVVTSGQRSAGVKGIPGFEYMDKRLAGTFVLYPRPFGIQAEYNIGKGPEFDKTTDSITIQNLKGGYITTSYMFRSKQQYIIPFIRYQYYDGGKKHERDARSYTVKELELGVEWEPIENFELVVMYTFSDRRYEDFLNQNNHQKGRLLRIQAQLNF